MKKHTQIFKSAKDFANRPDKAVNGVSESFVKYFPNWYEMNETNKACWNCSNSTDCIWCAYSANCKACIGTIHQRDSSGVVAGWVTDDSSGGVFVA